MFFSKRNSLDFASGLCIMKNENVSHETKTVSFMKLSEKEFNTVKGTRLFRGAADAVLHKVIVATDCELRGFAKGDTIYSGTSFTRSLGVLLEGSLRVTKDNTDGHAMIMSTLTPGSLFGAAALFNDEERYATNITALEPSRIVFFSQRLVERMIRREPTIAENYIKYLSERILFLNKKLYLLTAGTAEQRLSSFLLDNLPGSEPAELPLPMNRLADALNISRASLYRAMDSLCDSGAVVKTGKEICIIDAERLKNI